MALLSARILTTLLPWYPVRNPIRVSVRDTSAVTGTGVRGAIMYTFGSVPGDADSWTIDYEDPDFEQLIEFSTAPTDPDLQCDVSGSPATDDWVRDTLVPFMQGLFTLASYFDVSYDPAVPSTVILTNRSAYARNADPVNNGSVETGFSLSSTTEEPGADLVIEPDTSYVLKVYVEDDTVTNNLAADTDYFTEVASDTFSPSPTPSGTVELDLSAWLHAYVEHNQPAPDADSTVALLNATRRFRIGLARRYYVPYDEMLETGDYYTHGRMAISDVSTVIAAGRSPEDILTNEDWQTLLTNDDAGARQFRFLTNWPNLTRQTAKVITPDQVEYLCFIPDADIAADQWTLSVRIFCTDGTGTGSLTLETYSVELRAGRVYCAPIGLNLRDLWSLVPGKVPHIFRITIEEEGEDHGMDSITESRWFRIDFDHHDQHRQLHYFNSLCGIDTLLLTGEATADLDPDIEISGRNVIAADDTLAQQRSHLPAFGGFTEAYKVGSRLLTRAEAVAARELYFSDNIVERDSQGIVRPVVLTTKKAPSLDEGERFRSLPVQYRYNLDLQGSSPQVPEIP